MFCSLLSLFVCSLPEKSTIGVEFATRILTMADGKRIKAQIWDTAGQERYRAITTAYYRGALGAMLVYDVTKPASFENVPRWLRELKDHANRDIVLMMVGNKVDLVSETGEQTRAVSEEQARQMALELDVPCVETSAKTGLHVEQAFVHVIEKIYQTSQLSKQNGGGGGGATAAAGKNGSVSGAAGQQSKGSGKVDLHAGSNAGKDEKSKCC